jgi:hypothetical protein
MNAKIMLSACLTVLFANLPALSAQSGARTAEAARYSVYQSWSDLDLKSTASSAKRK